MIFSMKRFFSLLALLSWVFFGLEASAQIAVAPLAIFADNQSRTGEMTIYNQGDKPKEIDIKLVYGYLDYDSVGNGYMRMSDTITEKQNSIAPYVSVYPKKLVIQAGQSQTIKIMVKNTSSLPDGTYWTRIVTTSQDVKKQIDSSNRGDKVSVGINIKFAMVSAFVFQKGKLNTKLNVERFSTLSDSAKLNLLLNFNREGNSPFFGVCRWAVYDKSGEEVLKSEDNFSAYFRGVKAFSIDKSRLKPGQYKASFAISNELQDVPEEKRVPFDEMKREFDFTVQ